MSERLAVAASKCDAPQPLHVGVHEVSPAEVPASAHHVGSTMHGRIQHDSPSDAMKT
jgi:hypothetical protein